jgi:hypothetical protein
VETAVVEPVDVGQHGESQVLKTPQGRGADEFGLNSTLSPRQGIVVTVTAAVDRGQVEQGDEASAVTDILLAIDTSEMFVHGTWADRKATGDFPVGDPTHQMFNYLAFTGRQ